MSEFQPPDNEDPRDDDEREQDAILTLERKVTELRAALLEAIECIKVWHGPVSWDIYYNHSPEMKRIRAPFNQGVPHGAD